MSIHIHGIVGVIGIRKIEGTNDTEILLDNGYRLVTSNHGSGPAMQVTHSIFLGKPDMGGYPGSDLMRLEDDIQAVTFEARP